MTAYFVLTQLSGGDLLNDNYPLKPFRVTQLGTLRRIINAYPLATLISGPVENACITLVPLMFDGSCSENLALVGHLDANNPQAMELVSGTPVAFVFHGPNAYASPDLYPDPQLPGWLYVMVKGRGVVTERLADDATRSMLSSATRTFGNPAQQFELAESDPRIGRFINGITAFRVRVDEITGIAKLAQDKGRSHAELACEFLASRGNQSQLSLFRAIVQET